MVLVAAMLAALETAARAQSSKCADCHFANLDAPRRTHLNDWDRSAHGRQNVGCERCHGGNPTSFEKLIAHKGLIGSGDRRSPVHRANLPATCGSCHAGQMMAFQKTRHFQLLKADDRRGPTCSTCHSDEGDHLLAPKAMEAQCNSCHGPGKTAPRPERAKKARAMLEEVHDARLLLKEARDVIKRVKDPQRKARLTQDADMVALELKFAVEAGHGFIYDGLQERVGRARTKLSALFEALTNPGAAKPASGPVSDRAMQARR
ncbi:MAG: cytochrome c3 family protein [Vicinamibacterales bacterium]